MKKILAVLMSSILLLGILAGCNTEQPTGTDATGNGVSTPITAGMLVLNANASVNISYDADGLVLNIEGADNEGSSLAGEYPDYLGKSCSDIICDLIGNSITAGFLNNESNYVMIKQVVGSALPGTTFLETIGKDAEAAIGSAGSNATLILLTEENLDDEGFIDLASAKQLMLGHLGLDSFDSLDGTTAPLNGLYGFTVTAGDLEGDYIIDAITGDVYEGQLEGISYNDDSPEEEGVDAVDPTNEVVVETPTDEPTENGENEA